MKQLVHNLIILDESGSMSGIEDITIKGFNETIQTIKGMQEEFPEQEHFVTFLTFNTLSQKTHLLEEKVTMLQPIDKKSYHPNAGTPLYDTIGYAVNRLKRSLEDKKDYNVLVTVLTDGHENASREFNGRQIKSLIEGLESENWTFTYMGTEHDAVHAAMSISIKNVMNFSKNPTSMNEAFEEDHKSRRAYYDKVRSGEKAKSDEFFDKKDWKNIT